MLTKESYDEVPALLEKLLDIDKYNPRYYLLAGKYFLAKGETDSAKDSLEKSLEYDINNSVSEEATKLLSNIK